MTKKILVTGAAGFIGHHLANRLRDKGNIVIGVDYKEPEYNLNANEFYKIDLRKENWVEQFFYNRKWDEVYMLAADMGGMGFIQDKTKQADIFSNNSRINLNTLIHAHKNGAKKVLYTSSACVYPIDKQLTTDIAPLKEEDAYPANPEDSYGWEKLFTEKLVQYYKDSHSLETRIVRFHNIYGPEGTWDGGREKAPAALCRKVISAIHKGEDYIEIWGDGEQTRSFCYIDDCIKGLELIMQGENKEPVNLGRSEMVSINDLAKTIMKIAGRELEIKHVKGPQGVRGRNSDNTKFRELYGWEPEIGLEEGLRKTYSFIEKEFLKREQNTNNL